MIKLKWFYNSKILRKLTENYFKSIPGYKGIYSINMYGSVKSLKRIKDNGNSKFLSEDRILKSQLSKKGYYNTTLCKNGKCKTYRNSILVYRSFKPNSLFKPNEVIDHINNVPHDDHIWNLQKITYRQNNSKDKFGYTSKYVGVCWDVKRKKWRSNIKLSDKSVQLGRFNKEIDAAKMYQIALKNMDKYTNPKEFRELIRKKYTNRKVA